MIANIGKLEEKVILNAQGLRIHVDSTVVLMRGEPPLTPPGRVKHAPNYRNEDIVRG